MPATGQVRFKDKEVQEFLEELTKKASLKGKAAKKVWGFLTAHAYADVMDHFDKETGPTSPWKEIQREGKILQDTGRLRQGVTIAMKREHISKGILLINNVPYAQRHDEGLEGMPMRKFFWISDKALDNMSEDILRYLTETRKKMGLSGKGFK